ncbi:TPA: hypothetical protein ACH3X1_012183 [Trebouxia sp. C0004]
MDRASQAARPSGLEDTSRSRLAKPDFLRVVKTVPYLLQTEDLFDCLASFSKSTQAKTEQLHMACKAAMSAFKSQESPRTQNIKEYLRAATAVAKAVQAALKSGSASSCNTHVIQGKDVPANVREETNQFTQNLYESAPADFWESVMDDIEAIKATTSVVLVKYATNSAI